MKIAICISTYKLVPFVELNLASCRAIFGDVPILVCDDKNENSDRIKELAEHYGAAHICSTARRGHFAGDMMAFVNGLTFAAQENCELMLKLSFRVCPVLPVFRDYVEKPFEDPNINIVVPGKISPGQIQMPTSKFLAGFGILTDLVCIRVGSISPQEMSDLYKAEFKFGRMSANVLVEVFMGKLLATKFQGKSHISYDLANYKPFEAMPFLRKAQVSGGDYAKLANTRGLPYTAKDFQTEEWGVLEKKAYLCRPII